MTNNSKGFTLIELMAVIVILAVIGLIAIPSVLSTIGDSKKGLYKEQVGRILDAADNWASSNDNKLPKGGNSIYITIDTLQKAGLLKKENVKNPLKGEQNMPDKIVIYYDSTYNQYIAGYCDSTNGKLYYTDTNEYNTIQSKCNSATRVSE